MSLITSQKEIGILKEGGKRLAFILAEVKKVARAGMKTKELDDLALNLVKEMGDEPAFLNYKPKGAKKPFPAGLCVSVNEEVVHGIPGEKILNEGDVVSIDFGLKHKGLFTDMAVTFPIGKIDEEKKKLIKVTEKALALAIKEASVGKFVGDISAAIEKKALENGYSVVKDLGGHGVGRAVHDDPHIPNFGEPGTGLKLIEGMVIAIEPMLVVGSSKIKSLAGGYDIVTADGNLSAHFEHTVLVTKKGGEIITKV